jgi:hypothetical protein
MELSNRDVLLLDVSRSLAGFWLLSRSHSLPSDPRDIEGPSRTAALLFKKHLEGARIEELGSEATTILTLVTAKSRVILRAWGASGATLVTEGLAVAHFGAGEPASPARALPAEPAAPDQKAAEDLVARVAVASREDRRALLAGADSGLQPLIRMWPLSAVAQARLTSVLCGETTPRPYFIPPPRDDAANLEFPPHIAPFEPEGPSEAGTDFVEAGSRLYVALRRADLFGSRMQARLARAKSEVARLVRLKSALERDQGRWPDPAILRHQAEALLSVPAGSPALEPTARESAWRDAMVITIPDPRTGNQMEAKINARLSLPQNANALYERARNIERRAAAFSERWESVVNGLEAAEQFLAETLALRSLDDLDPPAVPTSAGAERSRYLTSRGLEMVFGRSAAENHDVTFKLAKREDLWFHVLDAPGGHIILRNREGRANREDIAEAAGVAAFLSERRTEAAVDVQYTERKHVHPAGGGKGRVRVSHAEVIRVPPLDPAGRLRGR